MRINWDGSKAIMISGMIILLMMAACKGASTPMPTPAPGDTTVPAPSQQAPFTPTSSPSETPTPKVACFRTYDAPVAFLPGSLRMLVRAAMGVQVFNLETMQSEKFIQAANIIDGPAVALSPDNLLAWAFTDGTVQVIDLHDQQPVFTKPSGQSNPIKLEFSPTQDYLYSSSHDYLLQFWDMQGTYWQIGMPVGGIMNIGISPDGSMLAIIPSDGAVTIMSLGKMEPVRELGGSGGFDTSDAVFSPDGQYLAADLADGLHIWNIPQGKDLLEGETQVHSMAVAYSADGRYLAYSDINNVVISSPDGSKIVRTLSGHQMPVFELLFSPDSSLLVSADDMEIRVWRVEDGELLAVGKRECP